MLKWLLQVRLTLDEPEPGTTVVNLIQTDVPEEDRLVFIISNIVLSCFVVCIFINNFFYLYFGIADMEIQLWWRTLREDGRI